MTIKMLCCLLRPSGGTVSILGAPLALDVLATIADQNERPDGYDRDLFAYGDTVDDRGCRTRALVLIRDSLTPAQFDPVGCAVTGPVKQAKGAPDPSNWIPSDNGFACTHLSGWVSIKARWALSMDQSEHGRIRNLLTDRCPEQTIAS